MLSVMLAAAIQAASPEASTPPAPPMITRPMWVRRPSYDDIRKFYPPAAWKDRVEGFGVATCSVSSEGTLVECSALEERPSDQGFGEATVRLMRLFKMRTTDGNGGPVEGAVVRIPVRFSPPPR